MTTLQPRPPYSPEELQRLYPSNLELRQVQVLLRHGERTPVNARFKNTGLPGRWAFCSAAKAMRTMVVDADGKWDAMTWRRRLESFGSEDQPELQRGAHGEVEAMCLPGELTDKGRETTLALGQRLRNLYVNQLHFLPGMLDETGLGRIRLRATPIPRALESMQQAFLGMYPVSARTPGLPTPAIVQRTPADETLFPNEAACKRFGELAAAFADRTAKLYNDGPELAYINKKIGKWMSAESPIIKVDSHPRLSGIMDTINATLGTPDPKTKLPKEFYDQRVTDGIDKICVEEWFVGYTESNEYRAVGIGALVGDLTQKMVGHAQSHESETPFRLSLAGCHDTSIAATLASLGAFDVAKDKWPNFTSSIAIELFREKGARPSTSSSNTSGAMWPSKERTWWYSFFSSPKSSTPSSARTPLTELPAAAKAQLDGYYVRLRYNDRPVTIPFCKSTGRHMEGDESFCTLAAFKEAADSFTPPDWRKACSSNLGTPAMREIAERPPGL